MASRKEQKEALRREREERERQAREAAQRRKLVGYGAGGVLALGAIVAIVVVLVAGGGGDSDASSDILPPGGKVPPQRITDLTEAAKAAGCRLQSYAADSREHISDLNERVRYKSNPPAAGKHYQSPAPDGAYPEAPPDTSLVHTQEHGRVIWWFKPTLPRSERADLKALFDDDNFQLVITPRRNMPYAVAATAWSREPLPNGTGRVMGCPTFNPRVFDALRAFRDEHRGNGPEAVP